MDEGILQEQRESWLRNVPTGAWFFVGIMLIVAFVILPIMGVSWKTGLPIVIIVALIIYFVSQSRTNSKRPITEIEARSIIYMALTHRIMKEKRYKIDIPEGEIIQGMSHVHGHYTNFGFEPIEWWIGIKIEKEGEPPFFYKAKVTYWADQVGFAGIEGPLDEEFKGEKAIIQEKIVPTADYDTIKKANED